MFTKNYIVLYPGEFEAHNLGKYHIKIIDDDYHGGKKAVCDYHEGRAIVHNRICAHAHFKPLDCKSYPYFPFLDSDDKLRILKGEKCPLTEGELSKHRKWFLQRWKKMLRNPEIKEWIKKVELVGYELISE
ncbi:unnamed protein product [marine sediment metagenome]|uniref:YkgJ family cysteine cluster protein n=1 Tax=marine sediment metagenome TaxID=412755 RepID=X0SC92_9ZZZZ